MKRRKLMISKLLVPTDGSKAAMRSIEYAAEVAQQVGASITLLSVVDKSVLVPQSVPAFSKSKALIEPIEDYLKMAADSYLEEAEKFCASRRIKTRKIVRSGRPVDEIVKEAEKSKVDVIVIGSRGKSALKAAVLGSVAFGVINKETKIPVLVVRK
jgi:nucleotide-binding universal stress UspA family protein